MDERTGWYAALHLSERQAVEGYLAGRNRLPWLLLLAASTVASVVAVLTFAAGGAWLRLLPWALLLVGLLTVFLTLRRPAFASVARTVLIAHLIALQLAIALTVGEAMASFVLTAIAVPATFLLLRLRGAEMLVLAAVTAGVAGWTVARVAAAGVEPWQPMAIVGAGWIFGAARLSHRFSTRGRREFLDKWRGQARMAREHQRMRGELDDARTIQLGMLPKSLPRLPWLDLTAISLPASEVGGDYYDFLPLDDGRLAVVVADVAGHGMSSGLVLASLRGGLYLLRDELDRPVDALERLGRMLRSTTGRRMFVTFQLALLDPRAGTLCVVSAGHPPLVLADAAGGVHLLGKPAPPLGTALPTPLVEHRRPLATGDLLVLYSDGVIETANDRGEALGHERLAEEVGRLNGQREARLVRDGLLGRIASFKGDAVQHDDMTIVALRYRGVD